MDITKNKFYEEPEEDDYKKRLMDISDYDINMIIEMIKNNTPFNGNEDELVSPTREEINELALRFELINLDQILCILENELHTNNSTSHFNHLEMIGDGSLMYLFFHHLYNLDINNEDSILGIVNNYLLCINVGFLMVSIENLYKAKKGEIERSRRQNILDIMIITFISATYVLALSDFRKIEMVLSSLGMGLSFSMFLNNLDRQADINCEYADILDDIEIFYDEYDQKKKKLGQRPLYYSNRNKDPHVYLNENE